MILKIKCTKNNTLLPLTQKVLPLWFRLTSSGIKSLYQRTTKTLYIPEAVLVPELDDEVLDPLDALAPHPDPEPPQPDPHPEPPQPEE